MNREFDSNSSEGKGLYELLMCLTQMGYIPVYICRPNI